MSQLSGIIYSNVSVYTVVFNTSNLSRNEVFTRVSVELSVSASSLWWMGRVASSLLLLLLLLLLLEVLRDQGGDCSCYAVGTPGPALGPWRPGASQGDAQVARDVLV